MIATPIQDMQVDYNQLGVLLKSAAYVASNFVYHPGGFMHSPAFPDTTRSALQ
jgi:hypothetical protein